MAHTIANGEIPLTISYLLPVLENPKKVAKDAARSVSRGIDNLLDGEGMPKADYLHELRGLLASWTRSRYLIEAGNTSGLAVDAERQFEWILQQLVRMSRSDGSPVLAGEVTEKHTAWNEYSRQLVQAAIELSDDPTDEALTKVALPAPKNFSEDDLIWELPEPSYNSEWAELAVLRSGWSRRSNRATLLFSGQTSVMEVESNGRVLLSGDTSPVVHKLAPRDNRPVRLLPVGDWKQTCWYSDADADYVELELLLEKSVRVQRHLLLAKEDRFVLLADAVLAPESSARSGKSASLRHTLPLPLGPAFDYVPQKETFDGHLYHRGRPVATMLPLCLPEWRTGSAHGDLAAADSPDRLELTLNGRGERMFNAVFIDLDSRRSRKNATWRQLTIAQERTILPAKAAQGFRVQCYADQWVIYRSLAERGNRTVLGHNLVSEFLVARFKRTGEVETLVEIE